MSLDELALLPHIDEFRLFCNASSPEQVCPCSLSVTHMFGSN